MDFVLTLHSHLPYVLHHGRWPHGSDWLCEAAVDTYLPLLEQLQGLALEGTAAPVTIGFTPVLANQLASPTFAQELEAFFDQREAACKEAPASLAATRDSALLPLVEFWQSRFGRLRSLFHSVDSNIVGAFRRLEDGGHLEIIGSAATHGYLPLLARDESIRLQLAVGRNEHRRLFGREPVGCWLPECAYRPRRGRRPGIEEQLAAAGFRYFFTDAHLAQAGDSLGATVRSRWAPSASTRSGPRPRQSPRVRRFGRPIARTGSRRPGRNGAWPRWCATRDPRCRSGAAITAIRATNGTSSSTRSAGPAASSSGG